MNRDEIIQALGSAATLPEQIRLVAELDALDAGARTAASADRSLDWADTTVRQTLAPARTLDRHTASSDWLTEVDTAAGDNHHHAVIAEAAVWYQRLDGDVKADHAEFTEQARGMARRTAGKYGEAADEAAASFLQYVAFLNREAASGLPQIEQLVDGQENPAQTPLPDMVFDNFAPPVHPINQGVDGQQTNSLAPGAQEAVSGNGGTGPGRPSEHDEGQGPVSQPYNASPSARQGARKVAGALERARHVTATQGHAMEWHPAEQGRDSWVGRCTACQASTAISENQIVGEGAHTSRCNNRSQASLAGGPSLAIGYTTRLDDFLRAEAAAQDLSGWAGAPDASGEQEAGRQQAGPDEDYTDWLEEKRHQGSRPFDGAQAAGGGESLRPTASQPGPAEPYRAHPRLAAPSTAGPKIAQPHPVKPYRAEANLPQNPREAASSLPQIQQQTDVHDEPSATPLPQDVMFPIDQPWPEQDAGTGQPSRHDAVKKTADTWHGGDTPSPVPGGETPVANSPATTPPRADAGGFAKGIAEGQADAAAGEAPSFADNSSHVSDYVRGYVQGFGSGQQPVTQPDVPGSMGGDNGQARNFERVQQHVEKPLTMAALTVSASIVTRDVTRDGQFQLGYRWARGWKAGDQVVALGSQGEEAGIYAGLTDNPGAQKAFVAAHRSQAKTHPELGRRIAQHRKLTSALRARHDDLLVKGLYVQAATSLDLDTMNPMASPDPQGATPSEGPGTVPVLRDAPGTPAAPGGPAPYNGSEPFGTSVVPNPMMQDVSTEAPQSPDALNMQGDSSLTSPQAVAFRRTVQAAKLARRQNKEN